MASTVPTARLDDLRQWFQSNDGYLNPNISLQYNDHAGAHGQAISDLHPEARLCTVPHSLALSSLNALVDDSFAAFRDRRLPPQAIGYFYLVHQYLNRSTSFWKPYLQALPGPKVEHRTPFWFDDNDLAWLAETDVLHTTTARLGIMRNHYDTGVGILRTAGVDAAPYTWDLFKWAGTMFTSRSFSSRALHPQDSKYWSAYKTGPKGRRQTVLLDMSRSPADDLDFPVLFPVLDIFNHSPDARVDWTFDPGRFHVVSNDEICGGAEVLNNYGPKQNAELLLGYGFCIENNSNDAVLLTLKPPPESLQSSIRTIQPGYFESSSGAWSSEKATFGIKGMETASNKAPEAIFEQLPAPLLELLAYVIRHERRLPFEFIDHPRQSLIDETSPSRHYLPHITRMIVTSLAPKLQKLTSTTPPVPPTNARQRQAQIYREGQIYILQSVILSMRTYLRSLLHTSFTTPPLYPFITTIEGLLQLLAIHDPLSSRYFVDGIVANAGTPDLTQLREAGWEEDLLVLLICYFHLSAGFVLPEYCSDERALVEEPLLMQEIEQAKGLMELVGKAAESVPGESVWRDGRWNEKFVAEVGGRMLVHESFQMMVPVDDGGVEEPRPVLYVHGLAGVL